MLADAVIVGVCAEDPGLRRVLNDVNHSSLEHSSVLLQFAHMRSKNTRQTAIQCAQMRSSGSRRSVSSRTLSLVHDRTAKEDSIFCAA